MDLKSVEEVWNTIPADKRINSKTTFENIGLVLEALAPQMEDAARFRFMMRLADNPGGPEDLAMTYCDNELGGEAPDNSKEFCKLIDAARARLAAK